MKREIKNTFRPFYYRLKNVELQIKNGIYKSKIIDSKKIPIIINNRNRITTLLLLIEALEKRGYYNIYIIDNASSYPPLIEYYKHTKYKVFHLKNNMGYLAIWKTNIYKEFYKDFYVYTDSDLVPIEECPNDFMQVFRNALEANKDVQKVGFSLKIDDLPEHYSQKNAVIEWEQQYYTNEIENLFYEANIDTTFALYRPGAKGGSSLLRMFRTKNPYQARHMPWYVDSNNLTQEEEYYKNSIKTITHWGKKH